MNQQFILGQDFGGATVIHPVAIIFTVLMGFLVLGLPRKFAMVPLVVAGIFVPIQQRFVIATLDFFMLRILVLFGWTRVILRSEYRDFKLNAIDKAIICWAVAAIVTYTVLWQTSAAFLNRLGLAFDAIGVYFLLRLLFHDLQDIERILRTLSIITVCVSSFMLIERLSGRNLFSVFGGVPEITFVREGRLRCQGPFMHPILAGSFGAAMVPLFLALFMWRKEARFSAVVGAIAATFVVLNSASSGPILASAAGLMVFCFWPLRGELRLVQWLAVCSVLALQIVMKAPVWALIMRVKVLGASTGYHRFALIDAFIDHFNEWWLVGTRYTAHWGYYLFDVTNHYIRVAVDGGIISLALFIGIIIFCFRGIGRTIKRCASATHQIIVWGFGVTLFTHVVSFLSVSYFDQIIVIWYFTLAVIATLTSQINSTGLEPFLLGGYHESLWAPARRHHPDGNSAFLY